MRPIALEGRTALITGSSRGIGRETARHLAALGCRVVLNGRDRANVERVREEILRAGGKAEALPGDVCQPELCRELVRRTVELCGGLDILVNNVGVSMRGTFESQSAQVLETVMRTNILGCLYPTVAALPELRRRRGSLMFVSSLAGLFGLPGVSVYSMSKMGFTGLAQALRAELAGSGVHVGIVYVGLTETDPDKRVLAADGTWVPIQRPYNQTQREVAAHIASAIRRRRRRTVLTARGRLLSLASRLAPGPLEWVITRGARASPELYS